MRAGEYYSLALDDPKGEMFILSELHGRWDEVEGKAIPDASDTLSPPDGYSSLEEAQAALDQRKLFRAKQGFQYCFVRDFSPDAVVDGVCQFVDVDQMGSLHAQVSGSGYTRP